MMTSTNSRKLQRISSIVGVAVAASLATLLAVRARAAGIPAAGALTYTGYLEQPDGKPVTTTVNVILNVWNAADKGDKVCDVVTENVVPVSGRFQIPLPEQCTAAVKASPNLWVEAVLDGASLGRTKLGAVPYAVEAAHAVNADAATTATKADSAAKADLATNATNATTAATANAAGGALATTVATLQSQSATLLGRVDLKVYAKGGNNGSVSCDTFCAGSVWGKVGTCVGSNLNGAYIPCATNLGISNASVGVCWCSAP